MDYSSIKKGLESFVERYDSQTFIGSYRETGRSSLLNDGLSTRANSLWKMAEYVVAKYDGKTTPLSNYINGWKLLAAGAANQYLLLEESNNDWGMYDSQGVRLGGEEYIKEYFSRQAKKIGHLGHWVSQTPTIEIQNKYRPYITAIKSKPFLLLAGISGTGKSRIVRELARACWDKNSEEYGAQKPRNFEMVQVKPNWHDSSELIGYVSRVSGEPVYVAGDFLKFVAKAWEEPDVPYFLCLDEMNLAPVEQYFAEYLSVIESRKADAEGNVTTDPILNKSNEQWYFDLTAQLTINDGIRKQFNEDGICIPQNLIIVGTVNMDETTFSFSRKVLDRAMTIEMNEVDLNGGLANKYEQIGKLGPAELIGNAVEGVDIYSSNKEVCDKAIAYLQKINDKLEGTPFKIAYRTRNEVLLYVVNNLPYKKDEETEDYVVNRALDEITNMKILSRIEGDADKIGNLLESLTDVIKEQLGVQFENSISLKKLSEMKSRLASGYTSFWS